MQVFIAESQAHVREALRLLLEQQGEFTVCGEAADPENLLAQVCNNPPELLLLDWNLPGLRPHYLLRALKRYCPATPVLATSVTPENARQARANGADGFILKSLPPDEFLQAIHAAIQKLMEEN